MNQIISPKSINFNELVKNSDFNISLNIQTNIINKLNSEFTDDEQKWFVANFYIYMNYHPTNDFPINLEHIYKLIGFANKGNAMKTIKNNFTENEDYKKQLFRMEKQVPNEYNGRNLGGSGLNQETIMLNVDTFKNLCMIAKTENGKKIRKYYLKLENIYNQFVKEEIEENRKLIEEKERELNKEKKEKQCIQSQVEILELQNEEKQHKLNLLVRKTDKHKLGESVYIFHSTLDDKDLYKVGRTKNANARDTNHKTASYKGILLQVNCVDSTILERVIHFMLDKYRCSRNREWFLCSYGIIKNCIYYAKAFLENEINFENPFLIDDMTDFINTIKIHDETITESQSQLPHQEEKEQPNVFTKLTYEPNNINDFDDFFNKNCEKDEESSVSYMMLKNQYKIWAKTPNHNQLRKMIDYFKLNYKTIMKKHNPLVTTSKVTQHFKGIKLKDFCFNFTDPKTDYYVIENYLYQNCQRAPGYRAKMQDVYKDFETWYKNKHDQEFTYIIKEDLKEYLDVVFIRLRSGEEYGKMDKRQSGWLGFALKSDDNPEQIKHYNPTNKKAITQINAETKEIIKIWPSIVNFADHINKSKTVTSNLITRREQLYVDGVLSILEFKTYY